MSLFVPLDPAKYCPRCEIVAVPGTCCRESGLPECDICRAPISPDSDPPLCDPCLRTAEAAGEQSRAAKRWPDPEHGEVVS